MSESINSLATQIFTEYVTEIVAYLCQEHHKKMSILREHILFFFLSLSLFSTIYSQLCFLGVVVRRVYVVLFCPLFVFSFCLIFFCKQRNGDSGSILREPNMLELITTPSSILRVFFIFNRYIRNFLWKKDKRIDQMSITC